MHLEVEMGADGIWSFLLLKRREKSRALRESLGKKQTWTLCLQLWLQSHKATGLKEYLFLRVRAHWCFRPCLIFLLEAPLKISPPRSSWNGHNCSLPLAQLSAKTLLLMKWMIWLSLFRMAPACKNPSPQCRGCPTKALWLTLAMNSLRSAVLGKGRLPKARGVQPVSHTPENASGAGKV